MAIFCKTENSHFPQSFFFLKNSKLAIEKRKQFEIGTLYKRHLWLKILQISLLQFHFCKFLIFGNILKNYISAQQHEKSNPPLKIRNFQTRTGNKLKLAHTIHLWLKVLLISLNLCKILIFDTLWHRNYFARKKINLCLCCSQNV